MTRIENVVRDRIAKTLTNLSLSIDLTINNGNKQILIIMIKNDLER